MLNGGVKIRVLIHSLSGLSRAGSFWLCGNAWFIKFSLLVCVKAVFCEGTVRPAALSPEETSRLVQGTVFMRYYQQLYCCSGKVIMHRKGFNIAHLFALPVCTGSVCNMMTEVFTRYTVKDGLSDNSIQTLFRDDRGYIWIGTDGGLNRFDGNSFTKFYKAESPLNLLSASIWQLKNF